MNSLHDPAFRAQIEQRLRRLSPDSKGRWGKMSVDQMLWHCRQGLSAAAGESEWPPRKPPIPRAVIKFIVLKLPWVKGAPTAPEFVAKGAHDFETERERCLRLIGTLAGRHIDGVWQHHPMFGKMTGAEVSALQAKHLDHHLRQFGA